MLKKKIVLVISALLVVTAVGCSNKSKDTSSDKGKKPGTEQSAGKEEKNIPVKEIVDKIQKDLQFASMIEMPEEQAKEFYNLDKNLLSEYVISQAMMNVNSDEVSIFKVKDKKDIEKIKEGINKRQAQLDGIWKQYLPAQYEKVKNHIIIEKGSYIMYSVSENPEKVKEIFEGFFK